MHMHVSVHMYVLRMYQDFRCQVMVCVMGFKSNSCDKVWALGPPLAMPEQALSLIEATLVTYRTRFSLPCSCLGQASGSS